MNERKKSQNKQENQQKIKSKYINEEERNQKGKKNEWKYSNK